MFAVKYCQIYNPENADTLHAAQKAIWNVYLIIYLSHKIISLHCYKNWRENDIYACEFKFYKFMNRRKNFIKTFSQHLCKTFTNKLRVWVLSLSSYLYTVAVCCSTLSCHLQDKWSYCLPQVCSRGNKRRQASRRLQIEIPSSCWMPAHRDPHRALSRTLYMQARKIIWLRSARNKAEYI